jgi:hypothetical protein
MPSGLAEQSPIYKLKVSDTLCSSGDALKFTALAAKPRRKQIYLIVFPPHENLELLDVNLVGCRLVVHESKPPR